MLMAERKHVQGNGRLARSNRMAGQKALTRHYAISSDVAGERRTRVFIRELQRFSKNLNEKSAQANADARLRYCFGNVGGYVKMRVTSMSHEMTRNKIYYSENRFLFIYFFQYPKQIK
jgi:hypothetical protein